MSKKQKKSIKEVIGSIVFGLAWAIFFSLGF